MTTESGSTPASPVDRHPAHRMGDHGNRRAAPATAAMAPRSEPDTAVDDGIAARTWRWWLPRLLLFGVLGTAWLARRRHRSRTGRWLAGDRRPGSTRRHPSEVALPLLASAVLILAGYALLLTPSAPDCEGGAATAAPDGIAVTGLEVATAPVTTLASAYAQVMNGPMCRARTGQLVATLDSGYARAGTTVGNVFITSPQTAAAGDDALWRHELRHVQQWSWAHLAGGPLALPVTYMAAESVLPEGRNPLERLAGLHDGNYEVPDGPGPGPSRVALAVLLAALAFAERRTLIAAARGLRAGHWPPPGLGLRNPDPGGVTRMMFAAAPAGRGGVLRQLRGLRRYGDDAKVRAEDSGRPGSPRVTDSGDRHASWLELFFDVAVLVAAFELATVVVAEPSLTRAAVFAALFTPLWWQWQGFVWFADRFDTDDLAHRAGVVAGMAALLLAPFAVGTAAGELTVAPWFGLAVAAAELALAGLYLRAARLFAPARAFALTCAALFAAGAVLWAASALVPPPYRYGLWALALAMETLSPFVRRGVVAVMPVRPRHIPERLGLFTMVSLGGAVLLAAHEAPRAAAALPVAAGGFALTVALWWLYFAFADGNAIQAGSRSRVVFTYAHLPLWAGIWLLGAGTVTAWPGTATPASADVLLAVGTTAILLALAVIAAATPGSWQRHLLHARLATIPAAALIVFVTDSAGLTLAALATVLWLSANTFRLSPRLTAAAPLRRRRTVPDDSGHALFNDQA